MIQRILQWFRPKPKRQPVWTGQCHLCHRDIESFDVVYPDDATVECLGCLMGFSTEGKKRHAQQDKLRQERRQIELYKQAMREMAPPPPHTALMMSPELVQGIHDLQQRLNVPELLDVFRKALACLNMINNHQMNGGTVVLRHPDKPDEEVMSMRDIANQLATPSE